MIDLETLGTNVDSQIVSIGACAFTLRGGIIDIFLANISLPEIGHMNVTQGTLMFWLQQAKDNPDAVETAFINEAEPIAQALNSLASFIQLYPEAEIWANGTKFDLGMLEQQFKLNCIPVPWPHNADRCMRTIRALCGQLPVDYEGTAHNALHDAIWQAKYTALALTKLGVME